NPGMKNGNNFITRHIRRFVDVELDEELGRFHSIGLGGRGSCRAERCGSAGASPSQRNHIVTRSGAVATACCIFHFAWHLWAASMNRLASSTTLAAVSRV